MTLAELTIPRHVQGCVRGPSEPPSGGGARTTSPLLPTAPSGWIAFAAAGSEWGPGSCFSIVTSLFADEYPVTDTIVMPIIGLVLTVMAAVDNVLVLWLARQRSLANILANVLTVSATLFLGFFVIGEGLGDT